MKLLFTFAVVAMFTACNNNDSGSTDNGSNTSGAAAEPAVMHYTVVNVFPHDTSSFTQGLQFLNGFLYEGTGLRGESHLMKVNIKDGKAVQKIGIDPSYFGEGITILNNKIFQLTWQEHKVIVYDLATFKKENEFSWDFEGWGITNDGKNLIVSTGSNNLYFVDPASFRILRTVGVTSNTGPLADLNELEYVNGKVYSNVWGSNYIAVINPESGVVEGRIDFDGILQQSGRDTNPDRDVLNGIAYDAATGNFFITGKKWPAMFEVKITR